MAQPTRRRKFLTSQRLDEPPKHLERLVTVQRRRAPAKA
jgi:hypothetical protein